MTGVSALRVTTYSTCIFRKWDRTVTFLISNHSGSRDNNRSILHRLWRKRIGLLCRGPKSWFQMKVNFTFLLYLRSYSLEEEWRGFEVQCEGSVVCDDVSMSSAVIGWPTVFYQVSIASTRTFFFFFERKIRNNLGFNNSSAVPEAHHFNTI